MNINSVSLVDCTLREGNQVPGVNFDVDESVKIAMRLSAIGVDYIEIGHPYASEKEFNRVAAVCQVLPAANILSHARARYEDIDAVARAGASWVGIFAGVNEYSQKYRLQRSQDQIFRIIAEAIRYAKKNGLAVRYTVEDASRTSKEDLLKAYSVAMKSGADRICFADSVGANDPKSVNEIVSLLLQCFPEAKLEVHFHDDRGLALANALAAIAAGVTHVSCSVNGIGERSGITDTCTLIANLVFLGVEEKFRAGCLMELSGAVSEITNVWPDAWRPVVGKNSFTHTSKLHVAASSRNEDCYHWIEPHLLGRSSNLL